VESAPVKTTPIRPDGEYDLPMFEKCADKSKVFTTKYMERPFDIFNRRTFYEAPYRNHELFFWDRLSFSLRHVIRGAGIAVVLGVGIDQLAKVGGGNGFFVCNLDPLEERYRRDFDDGGFEMVEMLYKTNLMVLIGGGKNPKYPANKVIIWDDFKAQRIAELDFKTPVKTVKWNREWIVVVLEERVYIYNFTDLRLLDQLDTVYSSTGVCALSPNRENLVLATLSSKVGKVQIRNYTQNKFSDIEAHNNEISFMVISFDGTKLATASSRGTIVRIFDTATGNRLQEFRRGSQPAAIRYIAFNQTGTALCLSSDKGTIHVFSCDNSDYENRKSTLSFMSSVVPLFASSWSSKQFSVSETISICAFGNDDKEHGKHTIIVLGASGKYYKFSFTPEAVDCTQEEVNTYLT